MATARAETWKALLIRLGVLHGNRLVVPEGKNGVGIHFHAGESSLDIRRGSCGVDIRLDGDFLVWSRDMRNPDYRLLEDVCEVEIRYAT